MALTLTRRIGTVDVATVSAAAAQTTILEHVRDRAPLMIGFANAHSINLAARDPAFRAALGEALVLNDGVGVDLASRMLYAEPFADNLNGTDFVPALLGSATVPVRLFLLGGRPGVAERAAARLGALNKDVTVAGVRDGYFAPAEEPELMAAISRSDANLILVALGQPLQERWAQRHWRALAGPCLCVGALLDFMAGEVSRAPPLLRRLRLEWAYRLAQEPRRLASRYLIGNASFLVRIVRQKYF